MTLRPVRALPLILLLLVFASVPAPSSAKRVKLSVPASFSAGWAPYHIAFEVPKGWKYRGHWNNLLETGVLSRSPSPRCTVVMQLETFTRRAPEAEASAAIANEFALAAELGDKLVTRARGRLTNAIAQPGGVPFVSRGGWVVSYPTPRQQKAIQHKMAYTGFSLYVQKDYQEANARVGLDGGYNYSGIQAAMGENTGAGGGTDCSKQQLRRQDLPLKQLLKSVQVVG